MSFDENDKNIHFQSGSDKRQEGLLLPSEKTRGLSPGLFLAGDTATFQSTAVNVTNRHVPAIWASAPERVIGRRIP